MYKISKEFSFSMGHRLSKHRGLCKNFHGHNYKLIVGIKSEHLNDADMVMDFGDLKYIVNEVIDYFDHAFMINTDDKIMIEKMRDVLPDLKILAVPYEPTAEKMAWAIYKHVASKLRSPVQIDYITVYETDTSQATYTE